MLNSRNTLPDKYSIFGNLMRSSHNPFSGTEMPGNLRSNKNSHFVDEEEEVKKKTKEEEKLEEDVLNDLVNLKLAPDKTRKIEKDFYGKKNARGKAHKRQLRY